MEETNSALVRSVLLECQVWRDSYANPYTSARVWINAQVLGTFGYRYGHPSEVEAYDLEPYLERAGVVASDDAAHISHRLRRVGIDYYQTNTEVKKRQLIKHTELEPAETFAATVRIMTAARARWSVIADSKATPYLESEAI